ncbi:MAG TPA: bifunctional hydroxymethylpyrimidine kinase/phosphomethylpyrimidine kinase [Euzebyales bacterium]|nr:bifunctional hydroxymethylpyrimidine kinase/phosphomethylpyrimidine kinase [Euzebyales bacterium]
MSSYHRALTIAGSDSGGGAGVQADLKTFSALGCYGTSVITALTAQNTVAVTAIEPVRPAFVAAQIDAVLGDIGTDATKIGMLHSAAVIDTVAERLAHHDPGPIVLDPVMVAKSGDRLLDADAVDALSRRLLPIALVITPNAPEAEALTGQPVRTEVDALDAARRLAALGPRYVVIKGGHLHTEDVADLLLVDDTPVVVRGPRHPGRHTHGTGCTFASAMAAGLALGHDVEAAFRDARAYVDGAIRHAPAIGQGEGPLGHFWREGRRR